MVMERNAQNNAKKTAVADKMGQNKEKKAVEVVALVTREAAILKPLGKRRRQNSTDSRLTTSWQCSRIQILVTMYQSRRTKQRVKSESTPLHLSKPL